MQACVQPQENDSLIARFCIEEFKRAVFEMNPDKAPRLEGMNVAFCQRCWPTIGSDVFSQCCAWVEMCDFPASVNNSISFDPEDC